MTAWKILLVILLILFLLGLIRVGGSGEYSQEGVLVRIRVGPFWIRVFPLKEKKEEKRPKPKKKKPKKEEPEEGQTKKGGPWGLIKDLLPVVCQAAGELKRRIRIDRLLLDYTAGGPDPANTAMMFGYSNAAVGMLLPLFEHNFNVKERRVRTAMDFNGKEPVIYIYAAFSARLGQLVSLFLRLGWRTLRLYLKHKKQTKGNIIHKKEAI